VKAKQTKECNCIGKLNKLLEPYNTYVPREQLMSCSTGDFRMVLMIPTAKLDSSKKRTPVKKVIANYCPLCGQKFSTKMTKEK
jgi:hypothetical protein